MQIFAGETWHQEKYFMRGTCHKNIIWGSILNKDISWGSMLQKRYYLGENVFLKIFVGG